MSQNITHDQNSTDLEIQNQNEVNGAGACEDVIVASELGAWGSLASFEVTGPFAIAGWAGATLTSLGAAVASAVAK